MCARTRAAPRGEVELTVRTETNTIEFSAVEDDGTVNATFRVNGKVFATITGDPISPETRGEGGRVLTESEMAVFGKLAQLRARRLLDAPRSHATRGGDIVVPDGSVVQKENCTDH